MNAKEIPSPSDIRTSINAICTQSADENGNIAFSFRNAMIAIFNDDYPHSDDIQYDNLTELAEITHLLSLLRTINENLTFISPYSGDSLDHDEMIELRTELALSHSLCPIHFIDYAICFDDETPDCAQIRQIHPSHDT